jgi:osmotically-inducible protein OsmY
LATSSSNRLSQALRNDPHRELWRVDGEFSDGIATLRGSVSTYHLKQLAQEIARRVEGVQQVVNRLEVRRGPVFRDALVSPEESDGYPI